MANNSITIIINENELIKLEEKFGKKKQLSNSLLAYQIKTEKNSIINLHKNSKNENIKLFVNGKNWELTFDDIKGLLTKYKCFCALEFNKRNNELFSTMSTFLFKEEKISLIRVDEETYSGNKDKQIKDDMDECDFAIINITDNNVNVFYELGYLICKKGENKLIIIDCEDTNVNHKCESTPNPCCKFKNSRFNVRQLSKINYYEFENEADFLKELYKNVINIINNILNKK